MQNYFRKVLATVLLNGITKQIGAEYMVEKNKKIYQITIRRAFVVESESEDEAMQKLQEDLHQEQLHCGDSEWLDCAEVMDITP